MATLSKKRFAEVKQLIEEYTDETVAQEMITRFLQIMKFDPEKPTPPRSYIHDPKQIQKIVEYRRKLRDEHGISTYISSGMKSHYERTKQKKQESITDEEPKIQT